MCRKKLSTLGLWALCVVAGWQRVTSGEEILPLKPTCASPRPIAPPATSLALMPLPVLAALEAVHQEQQIGEALAAWEEASKSVAPATAEDQHVAYLIHKSKCTGHEIAVALEFQNPVKVDELRKRYRWNHIAASGDAVVLSATPVEPVEHLFYRGFELSLDEKTHLPTSVRFIDRNGKPKGEPLPIAAKARPVIHDSDLQLVSAEKPIDDVQLDSPIDVVIAPEDVSSKKGDAAAALSVISPELESILKKWEQAAAARRTQDAEFVRHRYNNVTCVETVARGRLHFEAPDKARVVISPVELALQESTRIVPKTGQPYKLECGESETATWSGNTLIHIDAKEQVTKFSFKNDESAGWFTSFNSFFRKPLADLHALVAVDVHELKRDYQLSIEKRTKDNVWISAKANGDRRNVLYGEMVIILDTSRNQVRYAKLVNSFGDSETVLSFQNWEFTPSAERTSSSRTDAMGGKPARDDAPGRSSAD